MNLYTPGNPYVRPGTSWPQTPKPYQGFNQPGQQFTKPVPQGTQYTVHPQQRTRNLNRSSQHLFLRLKTMVIVSLWTFFASKDCN